MNRLFGRIFFPLLRLALKPKKSGFLKQLSNVENSQNNVLARVVRNLSKTEYGRHHEILPSDSYAQFANKIPLSTYDDLEPWIAKQRKTGQRVLVNEPVLFYEKTSGSSGPAKHIPYTKSLKRAFSNMFAIWLCDLLDADLGFSTGKVFASISPQFRDAREGVKHDADYVSGVLNLLLKRFLVQPKNLHALQDPIAFKTAVIDVMLKERDLEVISLWHPSFLEILLREMPADWQKTWPKLKLISCWTSAHAALTARQLREKFPSVLMQGKGLLATEAPMTIPLLEASGCVPLIGDVFFEFIDREQRIFRLHELRLGAEYEIVLTQYAGLYRYRIGDMVRVTHFYMNAPCFDFVGRADAVSDLVGEKLHEEFVSTCLNAVFVDDIPRFCLLLPIIPARYWLIVEGAHDAQLLEKKIEHELLRGFHYRNARLLGQIAPAKCMPCPRARTIYFSYFERRGMLLGDIKQPALIHNQDDATRLFSEFAYRP